MNTINCPGCNQLIELTGVIDDITAFHQKFDIGYNGPPRTLEESLQRFRITFMQEELIEYEVAVESDDKEKQFDALLDLMYVVLGTAHLQGFPVLEGWKRVHEANMKKVRIERAEQSAREFHNMDIVKPAGWEAPVLKDLVC